VNKRLIVVGAFLGIAITIAFLLAVQTRQLAVWLLISVVNYIK